MPGGKAEEEGEDPESLETEHGGKEICKDDKDAGRVDDGGYGHGVGLNRNDSPGDDGN